MLSPLPCVVAAKYESKREDRRDATSEHIDQQTDGPPAPSDAYISLYSSTILLAGQTEPRTSNESKTRNRSLLLVRTHRDG